MSADSKVVVVGASLAGWRAVETLRAEGYAAPSCWSGKSAIFPMTGRRSPSRCWPERGRRRRRCWPTVDEPASTGSKRSWAAAPSHLDAAARKLELDDGTLLEGDGFVLATGAEPRPLPGTDDLAQRDGLFTLRTLDDSLGLRAAVTAVDEARVVVIGAGFIGAEVASTCAGLGCRVTVLEALDVPLRNVLGHLIGSHFAALHESHGVHLRTGVGVRGIRRRRCRRDGAGWSVELDGGETFPADVVVVGIGVLPGTEWLADSGLTHRQRHRL